MESLERELINIGYEPYEAEKLYEMYARQGRLKDLRDYVDSKENVPTPVLNECLHQCF